MQQIVTTIDEAIDAIGGDAAAAKLVGHRSASAAANWRTRGRIPAVHYSIVQDALAEQGKSAAPAVFGMRERAEPAQ